MDKDTKEILNKYSKKIEGRMNDFDSAGGLGRGEDVSREYMKFKQDMMPEFSRYEKWAKSLGNFIKINLSPKDEKKINKDLRVAHLEVSSSEVVGLAITSFLLVVFLGILISVGLWFFDYGFPFLFLFLILVTGGFLFYYFYTKPSKLAVKWRLKASSQMVPAILYTVIYMKHTSNLERAVSFVAQNIEAPLSLDLRKVLWNVETGKFSSVKESLDNYLDFWRESNMEFVESFHLIESSLYEPDEGRRVQILERGLQVILDGVYDKMLKYSHNIKSPLTNLYMLGIVLPTLGLALLPLASTLLGGAIKTSHVFVLFNLIIPFFVYYLTMQIMLKRPGGYGENTLLEKNPSYWKYKSKKPYYKAGLICLPFLVIGLLPLIFGFTLIPEWFGLQQDYEVSLGFFSGDLFGFIDGKGPFSVFSVVLSLLVPFSIAMFFALSFRMRSKDMIKARNQTKELEKEFNSSLFTLGNRLGDGTPAEIAFSKVAGSVKGQKTEDFFNIINTNMRTMGMGLKEAIFNSNRGALVYYPSNLIATSMRILVESLKKGLKVAAQSLMSISEYIRNIQKINSRLKDLLADVTSSMKSNMTFLAPLLAGIVVGLGSMITGILSKIKGLIDAGQGDTMLGGVGSMGDIGSLFKVTEMVPPYFLEIAIGIYVIQVIFILTSVLVTVSNGEDKLKQTSDIAGNLIKGGVLYFITALVSVLALSGLASVALQGLG